MPLAYAEPEQSRGRPKPQPNPRAPTLTRAGYFTIPTIKQMKYMADEQLQVSALQPLCAQSYESQAMSPDHANVI